ncbi:uncharacterized protein si:ch211-227n13.3 isoform X1 [Pungitius pungitius]|uniref:uncharacterized protein si:ch211-227n13.3 isoform X1 n=2 Tax=Pungitius pungitius TaxID=134920 RepID=UPI0018871F6B|nr:uncharacterized protein si:ch211-227n13.3 isoform X1 [Pungitius pungitius]
MSSHVNCERCEQQLTDDCEYEAEGSESFTYSSTIKVEYYRLFEYSVTWNLPMSPKRSSRQPKSSKKSPQRSPSPNEEAIQRMWRVKRPRTRLRETDADANSVNTVETEDLDIIDLINRSTDARRVAEKEDLQFVEVTDDGLDVMDEDCDSVTSSIASGPSHRHSSVSHEKVRPSRGLCSACKTLYQKTAKKKAPLKKPPLDNNPESLTCDQWVLVKSWSSRRLPNARGKLLMCVQRLKERLAVQKRSKETAQYLVESSACSNPHTFLQRNLRRRIRTPVKRRRKNRRKRTRDGSQGRRATKQQRLHSNNQGRRVSISPTCGDGGAPEFDDLSDQEVNNQADANLPPELIPSAVTVETTNGEVPPEQKAPKTWGFRVLLAQLRGNSSMIVRE